jgi:hypothetical protein
MTMDPGWKKIRIRGKHPGSTTLDNHILTSREETRRVSFCTEYNTADRANIETESWRAGGAQRAEKWDPIFPVDWVGRAQTEVG